MLPRLLQTAPRGPRRVWLRYRSSVCSETLVHIFIFRKRRVGTDQKRHIGQLYSFTHPGLARSSAMASAPGQLRATPFPGAPLCIRRSLGGKGKGKGHLLSQPSIAGHGATEASPHPGE